MTDFLLRDIPPELWRRVKSRAALEGKTLRLATVELLEAYAAPKQADGQATMGQKIALEGPRKPSDAQSDAR